jgi:bifunctional non-homologous end joining protein LigD
MRYFYPNLPNWIDPSLVVEYDKKPSWVAERKKNGWRCLAIRDENSLTLMTRRNTLINDQLPVTRNNLHQLLPSTIIDGELMERRTKDIKDLFYAFDILMDNGKQLTSLPWKERRKRLEAVLKDMEGIEISDPVSVGKSYLYDLAIQEGNEGIVMKEINSKYIVDFTKCVSNPHWIKAKKPENHWISTFTVR